MEQAFSSAVKAAEGGQFNGLPGFQQPPPSTSPTLVAGTTTADYSQNVHHNWLQDKVSASAPDDSGLSAYQPVQAPWQAFSNQMSNAEGDFATAISGLAGALQTLIENPDTFGSQGIADLLTSIEGLIETGLDLADAMVDVYIGLSDAAMDGLADLLTQKLDWGPVNTLWQWMAEAAGYPSDGELTVGALTALLAAFPTTVVYKLIEGVDTEPFPSGTFAPNGDPTAVGLPGAVPQSYQISAAILQACYYIPALVGDLKGGQDSTVRHPDRAHMDGPDLGAFPRAAVAANAGRWSDRTGDAGPGPEGGPHGHGATAAGQLHEHLVRRTHPRRRGRTGSHRVRDRAARTRRLPARRRIPPAADRHLRVPESRRHP
ncbi:hypothetical protein OG749_42940 [Streptomyces nojiriensis]|uniref:hypothetical protein n=1 Tax=Streptomyces nojiriensis TaxID=66374 RepID=UPI002E19A196